MGSSQNFYEQTSLWLPYCAGKVHLDGQQNIVVYIVSPIDFHIYQYQGLLAT